MDSCQIRIDLAVLEIKEDIHGLLIKHFQNDFECVLAIMKYIGGGTDVTDTKEEK